MEKLRLFLVVSVFALLVAACGGDGSSSSTNQTTTQPVTISLSDLSATVEISKTHQFSATVENAEDTSVDWQVNKMSGGSSTVGTISDSGLYTAPDRVPSPVTVTVTAVAHADATQEASATVTIMSNVTVAVSPGDTTLPAGETLQFTAAIENANDITTKWHVNEVPGGDATVGTISAGLYTAPSLPPPGGVVTITAISLADTSKTDSVNVTVQFSNASLSGPYVFSISGHTLGLGPYYAAGRCVADGNGNIVSGTEDLWQIGRGSALLRLTGSYEILPESDGRGTLTLNVEGFSDPVTYRFVLASSGEGPLIRYENSSTGSGQIYKQDTAAFSNASVNGTYAFQFVGPAFPGTFAATGIISHDGAGNITGLEDINSDGMFLPRVAFTGTYSVDANGREELTMTATVGSASQTSQVTAYLISGDRAVLTSIDPTGGAGLGMAEKQQITTFSNASLSGGFAYVAPGDPATDRNLSHGRFTADAAGTISDGSLYQYDANTQIYSGDDTVTGSYSIPDTDLGRGTASLTNSTGTVNFVFYMVSDKKAFLIGTDTSSANGGQLLAQQGAPFSSSSYEGKYVFAFRGLDSVGEIDVVGTVTLSSEVDPSGTVDINQAGILSSNASLGGTYDLSHASGVGIFYVGAPQGLWFFLLYPVDSSAALLGGNGPDIYALGSLTKQF